MSRQFVMISDAFLTFTCLCANTSANRRRSRGGIIMQREMAHPPVVDEEMPVWLNGPTAIPDWVDTHRSGSMEANGTFLIRTRKGQARVHQGHAIIEHQGIAYTCEPQGLAELVAGLRVEASLPDIAVGPGKRLDRSGAKSAAKQRSTKAIPRKKVYPAPRGTMPTIE
jgi:hypothetical protein